MRAPALLAEGSGITGDSRVEGWRRERVLRCGGGGGGTGRGAGFTGAIAIALTFCVTRPTLRFSSAITSSCFAAHLLEHQSKPQLNAWL